MVSLDIERPFPFSVDCISAGVVYFTAAVSVKFLSLLLKSNNIAVVTANLI